MNKKLVFLLSFVVLLSLSGTAFAEVISLPNPLCPGGAGSAGCINTLPELLAQIASYISTIVGILAVLMFVISGIMFVVSRGEPGKIDTAKKIAIYAAVGVGVAFAGTGLVALVRVVIGAPAG